MGEDIRHGVCPWCKGTGKDLHFVMGSYDHGQSIWVGWVCDECIRKAQKKDGYDWYSNIFNRKEVNVFEDRDD